MKKLGRIGKANIKANKLIKEIVEMNDIKYCEMRLDGCMISWPLQIAHKHKRSFYNGDVDKLSDFNEWVIACQSCHTKTEWNRELNDEVFKRLRP